MMEIMSQPKYSRIARSFIDRDREETVFLIRMVESRRDETSPRSGR